MTKIEYPWTPEYSQPCYWDTRSPSWVGMPALVNLYISLNDDKLRRFIRTKKGRILDAGCGNGKFLAYADVGIDFSRGMLKQAKKTGKSLVLASIIKLPFRDHVFSLAFSIDVSLHLKPDEQREAQKELGRVSKESLVLLGEHRTVLPVIFSMLNNLVGKPKRLLAYLSLLLAFPIDRFVNITQGYGLIQRHLIGS